VGDVPPKAVSKVLIDRISTMVEGGKRLEVKAPDKHSSMTQNPLSISRNLLIAPIRAYNRVQEAERDGV
jgi:hypothetical protein